MKLQKAGFFPWELDALFDITSGLILINTSFYKFTRNMKQGKKLT